MMDKIISKLILQQVLRRALLALAVFTALCMAGVLCGCSPTAAADKSAFVTKAPVKIPQCHRYDMDNPIARNLKPECIRHSA